MSKAKLDTGVIHFRMNKKVKGDLERAAKDEHRSFFLKNIPSYSFHLLNPRSSVFHLYPLSSGLSEFPLFLKVGEYGKPV